MSRAQLEQLLTRLRDELAALERDGAAPNPRLHQLVTDVEAQLAAPDDTLVGDLRHRVETFEVEHPRLTSILNDIMVTLANLGI